MNVIQQVCRNEYQTAEQLPKLQHQHTLYTYTKGHMPSLSTAWNCETHLETSNNTRLSLLMSRKENLMLGVNKMPTKYIESRLGLILLPQYFQVVNVTTGRGTGYHASTLQFPLIFPNGHLNNYLIVTRSSPF